IQRMNLHRHVESAGFSRDVPDQIIFESLVLTARWYTSLRVAPIDRRRSRRVSWLEVERSKISGLELDRHGASVTLFLQSPRNNVPQVSIECRWNCRESKTLEIPSEQLCLERIQRTRVRSSLRFSTDIERKHQRIRK